MKRLLPQSLFGQTLLLLLAGLLISHAIGSWIYSLDRESAVRTAGGLAIAQRIANAARLIEEAPAEWQRRLVDGLGDNSLQVGLVDIPPITADNDSLPVAEAIRNYLIEELRLPLSRLPRVAVSEPAGSSFGWRPMRGRGMRHGPISHDMGWPRDLQVAVPLANGRWLSFATNLPLAGAGFSSQFMISMLVMALFVVAISAWAVRRLTAPLGAIADAAQRLGRDVDASPLPASGTLEMRQAAKAFNEMQTRLRALLENRTRLLAALSHDLRTPLTLLRLRVENVPDVQDRNRMLAAIGEMNAMIGTTLQFAREEASEEERRQIDVTALVQSLVDDLAEAGRDVTMQPADPVLLACRPAALKRALTNLIENAVKYGKCARVALRATGETLTILVDDEGPGIPEAELQHVLQPFYRLEGSRSRDTGGVGLGLAIAHAVAVAHGGRLTLTNRKPCGLRAALELSREQPGSPSAGPMS